MEAATAERPLKSVEDENDGLGGENPAGEAGDGSGIPGGAQPGDDGYVPPEGKGAESEGDPPSPPTPPAALPDDGGEAGDEPDSELIITGNRQLGLKVGGRVPDSSVLSLKGGKVELAGQFDRGDRFLAVTTLQVTGDHDNDTIVKLTGEVKSASKKQMATLCGIVRIEEYLAQRLPEALVEQVFEALELEPPEAE